MHDDLSDPRLETLQRIRIVGGPLLRRYIWRDADDPVDDDVLRSQKLRAPRYFRVRSRDPRRQVFVARDAKKDFEQIFRLIQRAHVRVDVRGTDAERTSSRDLG